MAEMKMSIYGGTHTLTVPSGKKFKVKRPSLLQLVSTGAFPSDLTVEVFKFLESDLDVPQFVSKPDELANWLRVINEFVPHVLVEPVVGEPRNLTESDDGQLFGVMPLKDISDSDKNWLFLYGAGVYKSNEEVEEMRARGEKEVKVADLAKFPGGAGRADAGPGGETVRAEAVTVSGNGPVVAAGA